ncbi:MAG: Fur family transcriptional regulator [Campylobacterota bacterium]|nr:Fur family transcriptional regulator [Campylobacterota bacterium]
MIDYSAALKEVGLRATLQRIGILEMIERAGHSSIDDVYAMTQRSLPHLSLATIYKNILMMTQRDLLVEVPIVGKKSKYEIKKANHIHLICEKCADVEDEMLDIISEETLLLLTQKSSFSFSKPQITLYGICKKCQNSS